MEGAISLTVIVRLALSVPPVLVAVIVYVAEDVTAVGVPLIEPVDVSEPNLLVVMGILSTILLLLQSK